MHWHALSDRGGEPLVRVLLRVLPLLVFVVVAAGGVCCGWWSWWVVSMPLLLLLLVFLVLQALVCRAPTTGRTLCSKTSPP